MATLVQLAQATGFSTSTVSRALRGHHDVSDATKQRVQKALMQAKRWSRSLPDIAKKYGLDLGIPKGR